MSLLTLRSSPAPRTPRERVYSQAEQYFDITTLGARSSGTQFLPSPITKEPTNNWSTEDQATWDQRLTNSGNIRWWLQNPNTSLPSGTKPSIPYLSTQDEFGMAHPVTITLG
ncbi:hypothetical protein F5882DRAFT_384191 [Hyaloscypha sp. PMI_1271]|nr:hypothetical protein F5882DRAFT_384191 [Hyaloscypha sp. PMI_1271]